MDLPYSTWYPAIFKRRSRRSFAPKLIEPDLLAKLQTLCAEFRPFPHARAVLVAESADKVFKGAIGPYGKVKGSPAFIAFIGDMSSNSVQEETGYLGEGIILEATALHLATCWVAGFFHPEVVASLIKLDKSERVLSVTPVGYANKLLSLEERLMTGFGWTHRRKSLSKLAKSSEQKEWPEWIKKALEAARMAPSAINRQPWRFLITEDGITISVDRIGRDFNVARRLDCGIAMLHLELAAMNYHIRGNWKFLEPPLVACFTPE